MIEANRDQALPVIGQTHKEIVAARISEGISPSCAAVAGHFNDAVSRDVNRAIDRERRPKRRSDGGVTKPPDIAITAKNDSRSGL